MQNQNLNEDTFIRHLPFSVVMQLASILDIDNHWEELASKIPKRPDDIFSPTRANVNPRYSVAHISKFARNNANNGSSTKALLSDWGTQNSQLKHLIEALSQAQLGTAAEYLKRIKQQNQVAWPAATSENKSSCLPVSLTENNDQNIHNASTQPIRPAVLDQELAFESHKRNAILSNAPKQDSTTISAQPTDEVHQANQMSPISVGEPPADPVPLQPPSVPPHPPSVPPQPTSVPPQPLSVPPQPLSVPFQPLSVPPQPLSVPPQPTSVPPQPLSVPPQSPPVDPALNTAIVDELKEVRYDILRKITNNFDKRTLQDGGSLIGVGGFGEVFLGTFNTGFKVAVKLLMENTEDFNGQFSTEVEMLCQYKHDNLVYLLGYSIDGSHRCLIYQYMPNGSLEDRLACRFDTPPLANNIRIDIAKGTARGIAFLHEGGLTHRDIKSANILLDSKFNPKVGDFATAKVSPGNATTYKASIVIGTQAYLAPEAFSFVIHPGLDCFSFGVVLLEILTGLPVVDPGRENVDLKIHVQEHCAEDEDGEEGGSFYELLDTKGGQWDLAAVDKMYALSTQCFEQRRRRPKMSAILRELEQLNSTT